MNDTYKAKYRAAYLKSLKEDREQAEAKRIRFCFCFYIIFMGLSLCLCGFSVWVGTKIFDWWFKSTTTTGMQFLDYTITPLIIVFPLILMVLPGIILYMINPPKE